MYAVLHFTQTIPERYAVLYRAVLSTCYYFILILTLRGAAGSDRLTVLDKFMYFSSTAVVYFL